MAFEPIYKHLVVGLVPLPTQVPPQPFGREALQRLFSDVSRDYSYQQFGFLPGDGGAQFNGPLPNDQLLLQPQLIQLQTPIDLTKERAREKATTVMKAASARLELKAFLQCGIKVLAHVAAPGAQPDAKAFVSERLMPGVDRIEELGPGFFGGGVKLRRVDQETAREDTLLIEPLIHDNTFIFVDYDVARGALQGPMTNLEELGQWLDEAVNFVEHEAMALMEV